MLSFLLCWRKFLNSAYLPQWYSLILGSLIWWSFISWGLLCGWSSSSARYAYLLPLSVESSSVFIVRVYVPLLHWLFFHLWSFVAMSQHLPFLYLCHLCLKQQFPILLQRFLPILSFILSTSLQVNLKITDSLFALPQDLLLQKVIKGSEGIMLIIL